MIEVIKGDLLKSDELAIVHGCNCFCTMGAGIALQIAVEYPEAQIADLMTAKGDKYKLGNYSYTIVARDQPLRYVFNAYTQYSIGDGSKVIYSAIAKSIDKICRDFPSLNLAMPRIGCGLGGGDWNVVRPILQQLSFIHSRVFRIYELP